MRYFRFSILFFALLLSSCANRGIGPQGGPKDVTPPVVVRETPANGSVNIADKHVEILFDEYVQLNDVAGQVLISPPQQRPPEVRSVGKRVVVNFDAETPLRDSTTYSIQFGSAICDLNERNPLEGYTFAFSTGNEIDTLSISGYLIDAQTLNPVPNVYVGIHANHDDAALETTPFTRVSRTDKKGRFVINNVHVGKYRLYALNDVSRDYLYQVGEGLAMYDGLVEQDTALVLRYFEEDKQKQYFMRCLREEQHRLQLLFSAPQDSLPRFEGVGTNWIDSSCVQVYATRDTVAIWLVDSAQISCDTLCMVMKHWVTDSVMQLQEKTDTIRAIYRAPRLTDKAREAMERRKAEERLVVGVKTNIQQKFDLNDTILIQIARPGVALRPERVHLLKQMGDEEVAQKILVAWADSIHMQLKVICPWEAEAKYVLRMDSGAVEDIYGAPNKEMVMPFQMKTPEDYATLIVAVENGAEWSAPVRVQLLSKTDAVVRDVAVVEGKAKIAFVKPDEYYLRAYVDEDANGRWTTGDWQLHRQPEPMFYYGSKLTLRANWDMEQSFILNDKPLLEQKPEELKSKAK